MSDFKAKMHQFDFRWGPAPDPAGSLQRSPDPVTVFKGPTSKGREGEREWSGRGREGKRKGREGGAGDRGREGEEGARET